MKTLLKLLSFVGLALTILPSFYVFSETINSQTNANLMITGTVLWFITAPIWMKDKHND